MNQMYEEVEIYMGEENHDEGLTPILSDSAS